MVVPFINHIATLPAPSCHTMSEWPSTLKSPVPTMVQEVGTLPKKSADRIVVSFMNQTAKLPLLSLQRISDLLSPVKSPVPLMVQISGTLPSPLADRIALP